jgi:hypothetical protein
MVARRHNKQKRRKLMSQSEKPLNRRALALASKALQCFPKDLTEDAAQQYISDQTGALERVLSLLTKPGIAPAFAVPTWMEITIGGGDYDSFLLSLPEKSYHFSPVQHYIHNIKGDFAQERRSYKLVIMQVQDLGFFKGGDYWRDIFPRIKRVMEGYQCLPLSAPFFASEKDAKKISALYDGKKKERKIFFPSDARMGSDGDKDNVFFIDFSYGHRDRFPDKFFITVWGGDMILEPDDYIVLAKK